MYAEYALEATGLFGKVRYKRQEIYDERSLLAVPRAGPVFPPGSAEFALTGFENRTSTTEDIEATPFARSMPVRRDRIALQQFHPTLVSAAA
jgi:hypothetical protein